MQISYITGIESIEFIQIGDFVVKIQISGPAEGVMTQCVEL